MTRRPPHKRKRKPCRKRSYKTKPQAVKDIEQVKVLNMSKGQEKKNRNLHVYECDECNAWHIGHKPNGS